MFALAKASVDEELAGSGAGGNPSEPHRGNGSLSPSHTNGHHRDNTRRATASQVRALSAIAERKQLDLAGILAQRFGTRESTELSIVEASQLIDELKTAGNGTGGRR